MSKFTQHIFGRQPTTVKKNEVKLERRQRNNNHLRYCLFCKNMLCFYFFKYVLILYLREILKVIYY